MHNGRSEESSAVLQATEVLFDKLQKDAYEVAMVGSLSLFHFLCDHMQRLFEGAVKCTYMTKTSTDFVPPR